MTNEHVVEELLKIPKHARIVMIFPQPSARTYTPNLV